MHIKHTIPLCMLTHYVHIYTPQTHIHGLGKQVLESDETCFLQITTFSQLITLLS